jgi:hypothetical protein
MIRASVFVAKTNLVGQAFLRTESAKDKCGAQELGTANAAISYHLLRVRESEIF